MFDGRILGFESYDGITLVLGIETMIKTHSYSLPQAGVPNDLYLPSYFNVGFPPPKA